MSKALLFPPKPLPHPVVGPLLKVCAIPIGIMLKEGDVKAKDGVLSALAGLTLQAVMAYTPEEIAVNLDTPSKMIAISSEVWGHLAAPIRRLLPLNISTAPIFPNDGECVRYAIPPTMSASERLEATVEVLIRAVQEDMVHPEVRRLAIELLRAYNVDGRETLIVAAVYQKWVAENVLYVKDPVGREYITMPHATIIKKAEDCDGQALLLMTMLASVGIPGAFLLISTKPDKAFNHVMAAAQVEGKGLVPLETINPGGSFKPPGWVPPGITRLRVVPIRYS